MLRGGPAMLAGAASPAGDRGVCPGGGLGVRAAALGCGGCAAGGRSGPRTAVLGQAASGSSPGPCLRLEGGIEWGAGDVVGEVGEGREPDLGNDFEHGGMGVAGVEQCLGFGLADVASSCYQRTREAIQGAEPGIIRCVAGADCGDGAFVGVLHQGERRVGGHAVVAVVLDARREGDDLALGACELPAREGVAQIDEAATMAGDPAMVAARLGTNPRPCCSARSAAVESTGAESIVWISNLVT